MSFYELSNIAVGFLAGYVVASLVSKTNDRSAALKFDLEAAKQQLFDARKVTTHYLHGEITDKRFDEQITKILGME